MVFSSLYFLYCYLPLSFFSHILCLRKNVQFANLLLLLISLLFYIEGEKILVLVLVLSGSLDFVLARTISNLYQRGESKKTALKYLILSIVLNLSILSYFKYLDFFISIANASISNSSPIALLNIALPLGISFYTFQSMSYTIDVYRKQVNASRNYFDFLAYITMFPQLVAGPIVRFRDVQEGLGQRSITWQGVHDGIQRFSFGLAKKVLIANQAAVYADFIFDQYPLQDLSGMGAWVGAICYAIQIYFDFSGYSDMAIGLGLMFGFRFPENFNYPYVASSIQDFWHRWHISLSTWFRDYLYIPLGGNRYGKWRTIFNQYAVFLLCGLWHGASFNFVFWGLFHGTLLMIERIFRKYFDFRSLLLGHIYTLAMVLVGWVYFRAPDLDTAHMIIAKMFTDFSKFSIPIAYAQHKQFALMLGMGIIFSIPIYKKMMVRFPSVMRIMAIFLFCISALILLREGHNPFIYFRF